jgi:exodeoxyribonuclease V alpha subunit
MEENTVRGYVKSYIYRNEQNDYVIAKLETEDKEKLTIVGYFPVLNEDMMYEFKGQYVIHPSYGKQFKVISYEQVTDMSIDGLIAYLSSSYFTGIGPKTAEKIVAKLGEHAIDEIIKDETVLHSIMNPLKSLRLKQELIEHQATDHILVTLYGYGLSGKVAMKLLSQYGMTTLEKLSEDPFRLMYEVDGFGFVRAMDIALKLGITKEDIRTLKAAIIYVLNHIAYSSGDLYLTKEELIEEVHKLLANDLGLDEAILALVSEGKVIVEMDKYFLAQSYYSEIKLAAKINQMTEKKVLDVDRDLCEVLLSQISIQKNISYTKLQEEAILTAMQSPIMVITGGPGTGKTTLIDGFISLYTAYYKLPNKSSLLEEKIALMAPTGRASKRMKELLGLEAKTIHRHLGFDFDGSFKYDERNPLPHSLVIIDEASMIDVFLARKLFDAISPTTQVIIVGDEDQLPSVGPGYVLGDLIASNQIKVVRLTEIHRQAKDSHIIKLASHINHQNLQYDDLQSHQDVIFYHGNISQIKQTILGQIKGALQKGYDLINDIQVLIPMYKGDLGIDEMNREIQMNFNPMYEKGLSMTYGDRRYFKQDKVIQLVNDPERKVMNGDIGVIKDIVKSEKDTNIMLVEFDEGVVTYEQADLENLNLAYVISIHKSQGSEYKIVFLPIIKPYMHMLKKELIYTAITRAKQYLLILGDMNLLRYASNQISEKRHTMLKDRLVEPIVDSTIDDDPYKDLSPYDLMVE